MAHRDTGILRVQPTIPHQTCQSTFGKRRPYHRPTWSRLWLIPPIHVAVKGSRVGRLQRGYLKYLQRKSQPGPYKSRNLPSRKSLFQRLNAKSRGTKQMSRTSYNKYVLLCLTSTRLTFESRLGRVLFTQTRRLSYLIAGTSSELVFDAGKPKHFTYLS